MAKKSRVETNKKRKKLRDKYAAKRKALKKIVNDKTLPAEERYKARMKLNKLPRNSSPVRVRGRCELTGRPRGNFRKFGICRNMLRELCAWGLIPGLKKSSW